MCPLMEMDNVVAASQIRPGNLESFIGQRQIVKNLKVYLEAALIRDEPLDHIVFYGPPGLGKTTLARILADAQKANFHSISAPNLQRPGDIAKIVTSLGKKDILFIDEIHRLPAPVEEMLYTVMEDRKIEITLSEGMASSPVQIDLPPFTIVGATTRLGALSSPLRDRFGIQFPLDYYDMGELVAIVQRSARIWNISMEEATALEIAQRSRGIPRIANHLLRRIWDFAIVENKNNHNIHLDSIQVDQSCRKMGIDPNGITQREIRMMKSIAEDHHGGPVGLKPLASLMSEDMINLEESIEPYLVRIGLIRRTPRGRVLSEKGFQYLGIQPFAGLFRVEETQ